MLIYGDAKSKALLIGSFGWFGGCLSFTWAYQFASGGFTSISITVM